MKKLLLLLLGAAASVGSARAMTIDITTWTDETFAFDVVWGKDAAHFGTKRLDWQTEPYRSIWASGSPVLGAYFPVGGSYLQVYGYTPFGEVGVTFYWVPLPGDGAFKDARISFGGLQGEVPPPTSLTATPDGYGAHFVFGQLPPVNGVPDAGSSAALLGVAAVGCLGIRKVVANTNRITR